MKLAFRFLVWETLTDIDGRLHDWIGPAYYMPIVGCILCRFCVRSHQIWLQVMDDLELYVESYSSNEDIR